MRVWKLARRGKAPVLHLEHTPDLRGGLAFARSEWVARFGGTMGSASSSRLTALSRLATVLAKRQAKRGGVRGGGVASAKEKETEGASRDLPGEEEEVERAALVTQLIIVARAFNARERAGDEASRAPPPRRRPTAKQSRKADVKTPSSPAARPSAQPQGVAKAALAALDLPALAMLSHGPTPRQSRLLPSLDDIGL